MSLGLVAVTGAAGFVGHAFCEHLRALGVAVLPLVRRQTNGCPPNSIETGDLASAERLEEALQGVECVVHCAARVHVMHEVSGDPEEAYRLANIESTRRLTQAAAGAGVRRMVLLSTVKVLGEGTSVDQPFHHGSPCAPKDPYARSKHGAENVLRLVSEAAAMEWVVIRPPLVYGPGVRANFERLASLVRQGWPLPLGRISNRRAMVSLDNLVDLMHCCITHPAAASQAFLVSDNHDLSTPQLVRELARIMDRPARLWPVPVSWLSFTGALIGRSQEVARLTGNLGIDLSGTCARLDWKPPVSVQEGLRRCVEGMT